MPVRNTNTAPLDNSIITDTPANNTNIEILVNIINPDPSKDTEYLQSHTCKKIFLYVNSTTKVL